MKVIKFLYVLPIIIAVLSCAKEKASNTIIESVNVRDSIVLTDLALGIEMARLAGGEKTQIPQRHTTVGVLKTPSSESSYLTVIAPDSKTTVQVLADSVITTNSLCDSLLNDLSKSSLDFINNNLNFIFTTDNADSIVRLFDNYRLKRKSAIAEFNGDLTAEETEILDAYNEARLYGFLFFYGMVSKKLEAENSFYNFVESIDQPEPRLKIAPHLYLHKYKLEYLRQYRSLEKLADFFGYIEEKLKNKDLSDYLKVHCLKQIIEASPYWKDHDDLLDVTRLDQILVKEKNNHYFGLLERYSRKFLLTQKGKRAFDFKAEKADNAMMSLGDLKGKVVFMDVWATWCAPCLKERPKVIQIAEKYKDNQNLEVLMVSVDASKKNWLDYLTTHNESAVGNVLVRDGMKTDFGKKYNIAFIPRYILIDKKGFIVNAYLEHPDREAERLIEVALKK